MATPGLIGVRTEHLVYNADTRRAILVPVVDGSMPTDQALAISGDDLVYAGEGSSEPRAITGNATQGFYQIAGDIAVDGQGGNLVYKDESGTERAILGDVDGATAPTIEAEPGTSETQASIKITITNYNEITKNFLDQTIDLEYRRDDWLEWEYVDQLQLDDFKPNGVFYLEGPDIEDGREFDLRVYNTVVVSDPGAFNVQPSPPTAGPGLTKLSNTVTETAVIEPEEVTAIPQNVEVSQNQIMPPTTINVSWDNPEVVDKAIVDIEGEPSGTSESFEVAVGSSDSNTVTTTAEFPSGDTVTAIVAYQNETSGGTETGDSVTVQYDIVG